MSIDLAGYPRFAVFWHSKVPYLPINFSLLWSLSKNPVGVTSKCLEIEDAGSCRNWPSSNQWICEARARFCSRVRFSKFSDIIKMIQDIFFKRNRPKEKNRGAISSFAMLTHWSHAGRLVQAFPYCMIEHLRGKKAILGWNQRLTLVQSLETLVLPKYWFSSWLIWQCVKTLYPFCSHQNSW